MDYRKINQSDIACCKLRYLIPKTFTKLKSTAVTEDSHILSPVSH